MIINEKQYMISKKRISECNEAIERINNNPEKEDWKKMLLVTSLEMFRNDVMQEVLDYETLKKNKQNFLKERLISELPSLLTEYKIRSGFTQKEFAQKLGIKEQQLQRYEATSFESVSFNNLLKYFNLLGLEIRIKETKLTKTNKSRQKKHA